MNGMRFKMIGARVALAGAALVALLAAAPANAAGDEKCEDDKNVVIYRLGGDKEAKQKKMIVKVGDETDVKTLTEAHSIQVVIEDGKPKVVIDGKEIPADQLKMKEGNVIVLDDDGDVLRTIQIGPDGKHFGAFNLELEGMGDNIFRVGPGEMNFWGAEQPKVMIGVTLDAPGPALECHLRLDPDTATMIQGVHEGLPADEAGLEQFDVIIKIDGETPADPEALRKALAEKEPGDVVELTVIHKGKKRTVDVELAEYDMQIMVGSNFGGDMALPFGFERRLEGFAWPDIEAFGDVPELRDIVIDENRRFFEVTPKLRLKMGDKWIEGGEEVEVEEEDLENRLKSLNKRLAELEKLLDELLKEADRK